MGREGKEERSVVGNSFVRFVASSERRRRRQELKGMQMS
jgi:hypothetical protein